MERFNAEHEAVYQCSSAATAFAMAWAGQMASFATQGRDAFARAAASLGYRLVPITTPAEDHAAAINRGKAEDDGGAAHARSMGIEPLPITDEPGFDGRDDSAAEDFIGVR